MTTSNTKTIQSDFKTFSSLPTSTDSNFLISDFNIVMEDENKGFLGKGSFATVFRSKNEKDGKTYALKIVNLQD